MRNKSGFFCTLYTEEIVTMVANLLFLQERLSLVNCVALFCSLGLKKCLGYIDGYSLYFMVLFKVDQLPRNLRKESWRKKRDEVEVSQRQAVSTTLTKEIQWT